MHPMCIRLFGTLDTVRKEVAMLGLASKELPVQRWRQIHKWSVTAGWSALIKETTSILRTGSRVPDFACVSVKALQST